MSGFWRFMSDFGFYFVGIFITVIIASSQSSRREFQRLQFVALIMTVLFGVLTIYGVSKNAQSVTAGAKNSGRSSVAAGSGSGNVSGVRAALPAGSASGSLSGGGSSPGGSGEKPRTTNQKKADIPPSFVDASLANFLVVPVFAGDKPVVILEMRLPPGVLIKKGVSECFLVGQAAPSVSSDRVLVTAKKLVCRRSDGGLFSLPVSAYVLDAEDGKLGLKARREELRGVPPVSPPLIAVAKAAELTLEQALKKGTGLEASYQVVRTGRLASVIIMEPITFPG